MKKVPPQQRLRAISQIARAAGSLGMVGGQTMDILSQGKEMNRKVLEYIHSHKTGALIAASVSAGATVGGASAREYRALNGYGEKLGLAFQIIDDLLDVQGDPRMLGKTVHKDQIQEKATYPAFFGVSASRHQAEGLVQKAVACLRLLNRRANPLREIAQFILKRSN
jgi:geranylgeranyl diphosphate synthase type II